jgi:hypothetical protein
MLNSPAKLLTTPFFGNLVMQAGPSEVKKQLLQKTSTCLRAKLLGIEGLRRFDGVAARGTRQELRNL